jgi:hypothetical protein
MPKVSKARDALLSPVIGQLALRDSMSARKRRRRTAGAVRRRARWQGPFLTALATNGMSAALHTTGVPLGDAVSARLADPAFRQAVERIGIERLAAAELMLIDLLLERFDGPDDGKEKSVLALWQALREDRRRPAGRPEPARPAGRAARADITPERAEAARAAVARVAEAGKLLDAIKARLVDAEEPGKG